MVANPRVWKEANTLSRAGYAVSILTVNYDAKKAGHDRELLDPAVRYRAVVNLTKGESSFSDFYLARFRRKLAFMLKKYFDLDSTRLLTYRPVKLLEAALKEKADLYICHQETGMIIGHGLLERGLKVAFDVEDWYSRDYINPLRAVRLLENMQSQVFPRAAYLSCPSRTMSEALAAAYGLSVKPEVIFNGFSIQENLLSRSGDIVPQKDSMVWFSQVIGPGRGLETLAEALLSVTHPMELHLAGEVDPAYRAEMESRLSGTPHKVFFHAPMPHRELLPFIASFRIGLALEMNETESRDTTISNKILQYVQAGNCIIATNTRGQMELATYLPSRVRVVDMEYPLDWARGIESLNRDCEGEPASFEKVFTEELSWEAQEPKLLDLIAKALA